MTICPIAIIASCKQCPAFKLCPLKEVLGDHKPTESESEQNLKNQEGSKGQDAE